MIDSDLSDTGVVEPGSQRTTERSATVAEWPLGIGGNLLRCDPGSEQHLSLLNRRQHSH
jgi:hypothetical protein